MNLLLDRALGAMHANDRTVDPRTAPGVRFGAAIGGLAVNGRNKVTIVTHPDVQTFGDWAEQLIAESTGKDGKGIVPVAGEALGEPGDYSNDRSSSTSAQTCRNPSRASTRSSKRSKRPAIRSFASR